MKWLALIEDLLDLEKTLKMTRIISGQRLGKRIGKILGKILGTCLAKLLEKRLDKYTEKRLGT